jgi:peptidoglycan/xylan/chitin deacetylase (PgdA/CDA1 family)
MRNPPPKHASFVALAIAVLAASLAQMVAPTAAAAAPGKPVIYLTFDDGPGPDTPKFLDLLAQYDIPATFFVTGRAVTANPATAVRIVEDGHTIANHTWNHPRLSALSNEGIRSEFIRTTAVIESTTGVTPTCYRPPYGATNARVHAQAISVGLPNAEWATGTAASHWGLWDIDTNDWRLSLRTTSWSESAMRRQLDRASDGDTILMHDGFSRRPRGLAVLRSWLAASADDYDFQVLPGCDAPPVVEEPPAPAVEPVMDPENPQGWHRFQIARLYGAYFDREPDAEGWAYWNREFTNGSSLANISYSFAQSSEFNKSATLDDEEFVAFVYANVLDREPDPEGFDYWIDQLAGETDRGELVLYFSEGVEYISRTAEAMTGDCYDGSVAGSYRCWAETLPPLD